MPLQVPDKEKKKEWENRKSNRKKSKCYAMWELQDDTDISLSDLNVYIIIRKSNEDIILNEIKIVDQFWYYQASIFCLE